MKLLHTVGEGIYATKNLYLHKKSPVLVYAPGRVGSMSLIKNLRKAGVFSFKIESFVSEKRGATLFTKKHILDAEKKAKIITLARDPVAMMATYFYSKALRGWIREATDAHAAGDIPRLQEIFIETCLKTQRLDYHLYWYENDFAPSLGFSVFEYPFDTEKQFSIIEHERFPTLILRTELDDYIKSKAIQTFLGGTPVTLTRENIRTEKKGGEKYNEFKETLSIPVDILDKIYAAPYVTHFFSPEEIMNLKQKWS